MQRSNTSIYTNRQYLTVETSLSPVSPVRPSAGTDRPQWASPKPGGWPQGYCNTSHLKPDHMIWTRENTVLTIILNDMLQIKSIYNIIITENLKIWYILNKFTETNRYVQKQSNYRDTGKCLTGFGILDKICKTAADDGIFQQSTLFSFLHKQYLRSGRRYCCTLIENFYGLAEIPSEIF